MCAFINPFLSKLLLGMVSFHRPRTVPKGSEYPLPLLCLLCLTYPWVKQDKQRLTIDYHILTFSSATAASSRRLSKPLGRWTGNKEQPPTRASQGHRAQGWEDKDSPFPRGLWTRWVLLHLLCLSVDQAYPGSEWGDLAPS